jgi:hypothetical protein
MVLVREGVHKKENYRSVVSFLSVPKQFVLSTNVSLFVFITVNFAR